MRRAVRKQAKHAELAQRLGATVREARRAAKLTQADVAERVGLQPEVFGRLERGAMLPSVPTLFKVGRVLGVSNDVLLGLADERAAEGRGAVDDGLTPELRRLLRTVRTLDREQLQAFTSIATALLRNHQKREQRRKDEASTQLEG